MAAPELSSQPENLSEEAFNARIASQITEPIYEDPKNAATASRTPPPGGWPLDPRGNAAGVGGNGPWAYGYPIDDPRNPLNKTLENAEEKYRTDPDTRAEWDVLTHQYPDPGDVLTVGNPSGVRSPYGFWPRDLKPSVWAWANQDKAARDPGYAAYLAELRKVTEKQTMWQAFQPAMRTMGTSFLGAAGNYLGADLAGLWNTAQPFVEPFLEKGFSAETLWGVASDYLDLDLRKALRDLQGMESWESLTRSLAPPGPPLISSALGQQATQLERLYQTLLPKTF